MASMGRHRSHRAPPRQNPHSRSSQSIRPAPYPSSSSTLDSTTSGYTSWSSRNGKKVDPEFKRFQKEYNLMLNSITDNNTAEVLERVRQLVLREVAPRVKRDGEGDDGDADGEKAGDEGAKGDKGD